MLDKYSIYARIYPATICALPPIIYFFSYYRDFYNNYIGIVAISISCGAIVIISQFVRSAGLSIQKKLLAVHWGKLPTTKCLRLRDETIDIHTKNRYHNFLKKNIEQWMPPNDIDEEQSNRDHFDNLYDSAVKWLIANSRDDKLILTENMNYGFRRNLLGLKPYGIAICLITIFISIYNICVSVNLFHGNYIDDSLPSILINSLILLWWFTKIKSEWVTESAYKYATALLATCDKINK